MIIATYFTSPAWSDDHSNLFYIACLERSIPSSSADIPGPHIPALIAHRLPCHICNSSIHQHSTCFMVSYQTLALLQASWYGWPDRSSSFILLSIFIIMLITHDLLCHNQRLLSHELSTLLDVPLLQFWNWAANPALHHGVSSRFVYHCVLSFRPFHHCKSHSNRATQYYYSGNLFYFACASQRFPRFSPCRFHSLCRR